MNGVPFPQQVQRNGPIGGPIVDLRLEEIRAAQRFAESRQQALEDAVSRFEKSLAVRLDAAAKLATDRHLGLGQDVENARLDLVKMLEDQRTIALTEHRAVMNTLAAYENRLMFEIAYRSEHIWEFFWASAWAWTCRKSRAAWERMKAPLWR